MWENIFKDYKSIVEIAADKPLQTWLTIGKTMVCVVFTPIGLLCLFKSRKEKDRYGDQKKQYLSKLFGLFLVFCGISRGLGAISFYHYFAWLDAIFSILAGSVGAVALFYIPFVMRAIDQDITLFKLNNKINTTSKKLDEVKELNVRHKKR